MLETIKQQHQQTDPLNGAEVMLIPGFWTGERELCCLEQISLSDDARANPMLPHLPRSLLMLGNKDPATYPFSTQNAFSASFL